MMASTHVAIGVVVYGGACAIAGFPIEPAALGCAGLGALLPDVDTPNSRAGWCVYPLASYLERKFGHRTITHSFIGTGIFAALCAPLLWWPHLIPFYWALLAGYASHLLADSATKSGVPLAWPNRRAWVFPGNDQFRIKTGSTAELGVLLFFLLIGLLMIPVHRLGVRRLIHLATNSLNGAVRDTEDWSDSRVAAHVIGYDVLNQKVVDGTWPVVGRRDDGALVIERDGKGGGNPDNLSATSKATSKETVTGYWLLGETGTDLHRIAPRTVRVEKLGPSHSQTVVVKVSNLTLGALARALIQANGTASVAAPTGKPAGQPIGEPTGGPTPKPTGKSSLGDEALDELTGARVEEPKREPTDKPVPIAKAGGKVGAASDLLRVLVSGEGECWPLSPDPTLAPADVPQFGLKAIKFSQSHISFDFAQPRHLREAGAHVAIRSATLSIKLPDGAKLGNLQFSTLRREVVASAMLHHADLHARIGQLIVAGAPLNRTFGQIIEHELTPTETEAQRAASAAAKELRALAVEEDALKNQAGAMWPQLASSYAQRRHNLENAARWTAPQNVQSAPPAPVTAPFDCVVENIEWEPPAQPTQKGEKATLSARLSLVKVQR